MKIFRINYLFIISIFFATFFTGACDTDNNNQATKTPPSLAESETNQINDSDLNVVASLIANDRLSLFAQALIDTGLMDMLASSSTTTIFAPTNEAFEAYQREYGGLDEFLSNHAKLRKILGYHIVLGQLMAEDLILSTEILSASDFYLTIYTSNHGEIYVNDFLVNAGKHLTSNGTIYEIDSILLPSDQQEMTDEEQTRGLYEMILAYEDLSIFAQLARIGRIHEALNDFGPFTVFAPTNEAFSKIDSTRLEYFLGDEDAAATIIELHTIANEFMLDAIRQSSELRTLSGVSINTSTDETGALYVDKSKIISPNIRAENGILHIIDHLFLHNPGDNGL